MMLGVNRRSLLTSLNYFDVTSGLLIPDVMHDFLEGVVPLELKLILKVGIRLGLEIIRLSICVGTYFG